MHVHFPDPASLLFCPTSNETWLRYFDKYVSTTIWIWSICKQNSWKNGKILVSKNSNTLGTVRVYLYRAKGIFIVNYICLLTAEMNALKNYRRLHLHVHSRFYLEPQLCFVRSNRGECHIKFGWSKILLVLCQSSVSCCFDIYQIPF